MKKSIKIALVIIIVLIFVAVIVLGGLVTAELFKKRDISGTPFESRYVLDESGNFIANIPFEHYLYTPEYPSDEKIFDIRVYGASTSADFTVNRTAINNAISAANAAGGGIVLVDGGEYTCANIRLLSYVTLRISRGSALVNINYDTAVSQNADYFSSDEDAPVLAIF